VAKKSQTNKAGGRVTPRKATGPIATAADFKDPGQPLELPSGLTVKVRRPKGLTSFLTGGQIPNSLLPLLTDAMDGKQPEPETLKDLLEDPKKLADVMAMADALVVAYVVDPPVAPVPDPGFDRSDLIVYTDEWTDDDKMYVMQYAMVGAEDLGTFRTEQATFVDAMANVEGVPDPTVATAED
jgi:hypothetical protein